MPAPTGAEVWRDYVTNGVPSSGRNEPKKAEIRDWAKAREAAEGALTMMLGASQGAVKGTKASLDAVVGDFANGDVGVVYADTDSLSGVYVKTGGVWVKDRDLPDIAAEAAKDAAEAAREDAESAKDAAEAARDQAAGYVNEIVSEKEVPIYGTAAGLAAITVPAGMTSIRTNGRTMMGDGGAYLLEEVAEDGSPLASNQFRSNGNTRRWQIADDGSVRSDVKTPLADARQARALKNLGLGGFSAEIQRKIRTLIGKVANGDGQRLAVLGDSTNAGVGGSEHPGNSWGTAKIHTPIAVAMNILQASGIECRHDAFIGSNGMDSIVQYSQYNGRVVFEGTGWTVETGMYAGGAYFQIAGWFGPSNAMRFTPRKNADRFDIWYISNAGTQGFTVSDASGVLGTFTTAGSPGVHKVTIQRAVASTDEIELYLTANGVGYIIGIDPWNSTLPELRVLNMAVSGWRAGYYTVNSQAFNSRPAVNAIDPDFTIIEFGINDRTNGDSLGGFIANMRILIGDRLPKGVALGISAPVEASLAGNLPASWRDAIADLAEEYGLPCIDHYTVFKSYETNPDLYFDPIHPNRAGYGLKGRNLSNWMAA